MERRCDRCRKSEDEFGRNMLKVREVTLCQHEGHVLVVSRMLCEKCSVRVHRHFLEIIDKNPNPKEDVPDA